MGMKRTNLYFAQVLHHIDFFNELQTIEVIPALSSLMFMYSVFFVLSCLLSRTTPVYSFGKLDVFFRVETRVVRTAHVPLDDAPRTLNGS